MEAADKADHDRERSRIGGDRVAHGRAVLERSPLKRVTRASFAGVTPFRPTVYRSAADGMSAPGEVSAGRLERTANRRREFRVEGAYPTVRTR
jgi:hypothetical protein